MTLGQFLLANHLVEAGLTEEFVERMQENPEEHWMELRLQVSCVFFVLQVLDLKPKLDI